MTKSEVFWRRKSCTIIINGRQVCIRDGTWYECEVREYRAANGDNLHVKRRVDTCLPTSSGKSTRSMTV